MDRQGPENLSILLPAASGPVPDRPGKRRKRLISRRQAIKLGAAALGGLACSGSLLWLINGETVGDFLRNLAGTAGPGSADIFKGDAPKDEVWQLWRQRGWTREAQGQHYLKLGRNVQCKICPNNCLLAPGDRSHCRNKINRDGTLYTLAYSNPCAYHVDPVEKKPLFHFLPGTWSFSIATAGCVFRCLNCQNWEISQKTPEETKNVYKPECCLNPRTATQIGTQAAEQWAKSRQATEGSEGSEGSLPAKLDPRVLLAFCNGLADRVSMHPEDVADLALWTGCSSIAYTYTEPVAFYEYTYDCCKLARERKVRNIMVTCGSINEAPLTDLARYLDAVHVDLKGFDEGTYKKLNSGQLKPILNTLKTLERLGVWYEIINLVVPTYTDNLEMVKRMCGWLVDNVGPNRPLHFSRFSPLHKLTDLWPTPVDTLVEARQIARSAGLHYVYIGNVASLAAPDAETTFCPNCGKPVIERSIFAVTRMDAPGGRCKSCGAKIAGVWT